MQILYIVGITILLFFSLKANKVEKCQNNCYTPFGSMIGVNEKVEAYSNCNDDCISYEFNFIDLPNMQKVFTGLKWQCVEYARRYLILTMNVTFGDVESAYQIYNLFYATSIFNKEQKYKFIGYPNGSAELPKKNDLLIFKQTLMSPYGHVAVITSVNSIEGYVEICEENYNQKWDFPSYSRRIILEKKNGQYYIKEQSYFPYRLDSYLGEIFSSVIGWKRVIKE